MCMQVDTQDEVDRPAKIRVVWKTVQKASRHSYHKGYFSQIQDAPIPAQGWYEAKGPLQIREKHTIRGINADGSFDCRFFKEVYGGAIHTFLNKPEQYGGYYVRIKCLAYPQDWIADGRYAGEQTQTQACYTKVYILGSLRSRIVRRVKDFFGLA